MWMTLACRSAVLLLYLNLLRRVWAVSPTEPSTDGVMDDKEELGDSHESSFFYPLNVIPAGARQTPQNASSNAPQAGIVWQNVAFHTPSRNPRTAGEHRKTSTTSSILEPFSFHVANGRVCAILGPSGSGKTTLLKSLAAVLKHDGHVYLYQSRQDHEDDGPRQLHLSPLYQHANQVAWLQQQDNFFDKLTVRETLELAAFLELPHASNQERQSIVNSLMDSLGLQPQDSWRNRSTTASSSSSSSASTRTLSSRPAGVLSGGERRRLSVALELLSSEQVRVLLADEPTSGLDASLSEKALKLIQSLARHRNIPCLVTLHQPRSSIWNHRLDDCILMAHGGRVCYAGSTEQCLDYFDKLGYTCPPATNPAEFLIDLVSVDNEDAQQAERDRSRIQELAAAFRRYQRLEWSQHDSLLGTQTIQVVIERPSQKPGRVLSQNPLVGIFRFAALVRRSWRQNVRNHAVNTFRLVASAGNAVLLAQIFPTVRGPIPTANSVADRVALLSFGAINMCMLAFMKAVELFGKEKPVIQREQRRHQYTALEYLLAKGLAELPLDIGFACVFTSVLKLVSGIRISWRRLSAVFSLMTAAGASLGFLLGSWAPSGALAQQAGIPILVILMVVGIINPSGVDPNLPTPRFLQILKMASPFAHCIEALCLGEYTGMVFLRQGWKQRVGNLRMGGLALVKNGDQVLEALGLHGKNFEGTMKQLAALTGVNFLMSWLGLLVYGHYQSPKQSEKHWNTRSRDTSAGEPDPIYVPIRTRL